jgi:hypothetical protein
MTLSERVKAMLDWYGAYSGPTEGPEPLVTLLGDLENDRRKLLELLDDALAEHDEEYGLSMERNHWSVEARRRVDPTYERTPREP